MPCHKHGSSSHETSHCLPSHLPMCSSSSSTISEPSSDDHGKQTSTQKPTLFDERCEIDRGVRRSLYQKSPIRWGRTQQAVQRSICEPFVDYETLSFGIGGDEPRQPEGSSSHPCCGNRARHGSEQPYHRLPMLLGSTGSRKQMDCHRFETYIH